MAVEKLSPGTIPTKAKSKRVAITQRGYEIVSEYSDKISGAKQKRPGLDQLLADAGRHKFDVVLVWAFDRMARSVRHCAHASDPHRGCVYCPGVHHDRLG